LNRYTVSTADGEKRSVTLDDLRAWHAQGHITDNTPVINEETGKQVPVSMLLKIQPFKAPDIPNESTYDTFANKIGFVPNFKKEDNLFQAKIFGIVWGICVAVGAILGVVLTFDIIVGFIMGGFFGGLLGLVIALLVSGIIVGARTSVR